MTEETVKQEKPKEIEVKKEVKQTEKKKEPPVQKGRAADDVVFIGKKPDMSYVMAVITQFSEGITKVHLRARGRSISKAVDVAEVVSICVEQSYVRSRWIQFEFS